MQKERTHEYYLKLALKEAQRALEEDEVPVGAVIVMNNRVIGTGYNMCEKLQDPTAHAEMIAITSACNHLDSRYLEHAALYVTLEPCLMCAGAIAHANISHLIYGATDKKEGYNNFSNSILPKRTSVVKGVLKSECAFLMTEFFSQMRKK